MLKDLLEALESGVLSEQKNTYSQGELTPVIIDPPSGGGGGLPPQAGGKQIEVEVIRTKPQDEEDGESGDGPGGAESETVKTGKPGKPGKPKPGQGKQQTLDSHDILGKSNKADAKEMAEKILEAADEVRKKRAGRDEASPGRGSGSGDFIDKLRDAYKPKIDWVGQLRKKITEFKSKTAAAVNKHSRKTASKYKEGTGKVKSKAYHQWLRDPRSHAPGSKILYKGPYVKAPVGEIILIVALDTSGSIPSETVSKVFAEMDKIAQAFKSGVSSSGVKLKGRVYFMSWDTEVKQATEYKAGEWKKYAEGSKTIKGGGGTTVGSIFDYLQEHLLTKEEGPAVLNIVERPTENASKPNDIVIPIKQEEGAQSAIIAPFVVIATDGYTEKLTEPNLGTLYKNNKDNILYLVIDGTTENCYPENIIEYESYKI